MNWFTAHSAAIQSIASVVAVLITAYLATITRRYVQLTGAIAQSSATQVQEMKNAAAEAKKRNAQALTDLATRIRNSLARLDADIPRDAQLRHFDQVTDGDCARLEMFAQQIGNGTISASAGAAVVAIRDILHVGHLIKSVNVGTGLRITQQMIDDWRRAKEESDRSLHAIQDECARLLA